MKDSTFEPTQPQPTEKPKEPSAYERKMQNMLEASRGRIIAFAEDTSLSFRAGKGFSFQPETGVITHDASWFEKRGFEPEAILFAIFHELTHFRDYRQDTKYSDRLFKENFAKARFWVSRFLINGRRPKEYQQRCLIPLSKKSA